MRLPSLSNYQHWPWARIRDGALAIFVLLALLSLYFYWHAARTIDEKIAVGPFANTVNLYAAPAVVQTGDRLDIKELIRKLETSGYAEEKGNSVGWYTAASDSIVIQPGPQARIAQTGCEIKFKKDRIAAINAASGGSTLSSCTLEPRMIANLGNAREKRRPMAYAEFPPVLVQAVLSVEDKRFFNHWGVDFIRAVKAAYVDIREGSKEQGASTLTMQLVRSLWLEPDKKWVRKLKEMIMAMHLEEKMSKEQIFEYYGNEIYLGRHGTFSLHGFGEAARAFFNKEPKELNLEEAALLAGLARAPSVYNPFRNPKLAKDRRNIVLYLMKQNGYLRENQYRAAADSPLGVKPGAVTPLESPFLMDLVQEEVRKQEGEENSSYTVYTTVDLDLQGAAEEAIAAEMPKLDKLVRRVHGKKYDGTPVQVALVAVEPRTGSVKAFVGGRNYAQSQLNRGVALRQPGSVFKPFVYAAALNTAIEGGSSLFTPATVVADEPSTFLFNGKVYEPGNFGQSFYGNLTLRAALAKSVNVATVKVAESVGYSKIAKLAHDAGLNHGIAGTPSVALGAYEATPLEIAGAYTIFANQGVFLEPAVISVIESKDGKLKKSITPEKHQVLDPRVSYLMVSMMEEVINAGTGAGARARGFQPPAAGKTGTSRDGWFAGFTSELIAVVWVGFDDNRDLKLEGSKSALPVWTEFMKRAHKLPAYADTKPFKPPAGIVSASIDPESGGLATDNCPEERVEYFIGGTTPGFQCDLHRPIFIEYSMMPPDAVLSPTTQR
jgi:penicillin-binding protein 1B